MSNRNNKRAQEPGQYQHQGWQPPKTAPRIPLSPPATPPSPVTGEGTPVKAGKSLGKKIVFAVVSVIIVSGLAIGGIILVPRLLEQTDNNGASASSTTSVTPQTSADKQSQAQVSQPQTPVDPEVSHGVAQPQGYSFANDEPLPENPLILSTYLGSGEKTAGLYNGRFYSVHPGEGDYNTLRSTALDGSDIREHTEVQMVNYSHDRLRIIGEYIYFVYFERGAAYTEYCRVPVSGGAREYLFNADLGFLPYTDDQHIYTYADYEDGGGGLSWIMSRCALDGSGNEQLWETKRDLRRGELVATADNKLIYLAESETYSDERRKIIAIDIASGEETVLAEDVIYLARIEDYIYYATKDWDPEVGELMRHQLYRIKTDGTDRRQLLNDDESILGGSINFGKNAIYCAIELYPPDATSTMDCLDFATYRLELDGSDRVRLMDDFMANLAVSSGESDLFMCDDGSDLIGKLDAESGEIIWFEDTKGAFRLLFAEGGWVYYYKYSGGTDTYCRVRTDGTENTTLFSHTN